MKNILSKLWLSITGMVVLLLIVIWWFNISLLDRFYVQDRINNLYEKGEAIAHMLELSYSDGINQAQSPSQQIKSIILSDDSGQRPDAGGNGQRQGAGGNGQRQQDAGGNGQRPDAGGNGQRPDAGGNGQRQQDAGINAQRPVALPIPNGLSNFEPKELKEDFFYYLEIENIDALYKILSRWPSPNRLSDLNMDDIKENVQSGERFNQKIPLKKESSFHTLLVGVPVKKDGTVKGYLLFFSLARNISQTTSILKKQFALIALISIAVSSVFAFMLAKYFTKPILLIKSVSDTISKGRYGMQVSVKNNDEIGLLAKSINRMSRELAKIEGLRRDFIANITHEFKTPLSVIKSYSEMITDIDLDDKESIKYDAKVILDETERLNSMVSDILYLSKIQSDNSAVNIDRINVCDAFREIIDRTINMASASGVRIVKDCPDPVFIMADREKITRCLMNFMVNSINHTPSGKSVHISAAQNSDGSVSISVKDEGCGISRDDLPQIWERFYKADKSRKSGPQGTGLGMAIAKDILEMHGFEYGISSSEGEGTEVYFKTKPQ